MNNQLMKGNKTKASWRMLILMGFMLMASCDKNDEPTPPPVDPPAPTETVAFNKLIEVRNFGENLPTGSAPTTDQSPIFFSLETNKGASSDHKLTTRWDLSFSGIFRGVINCNNSRGGQGAHGPGKGGIMIVKKKFEEVIDVPADSEFEDGSGGFSSDDSGAWGEGLGWYLYDFNGNIIGDGSAEKKHIAYPIMNHTLVVRTANGHYAKIKMLSLYKDLLDPKTWLRTSPSPYFSFDYVLVKAGSKKFEIK